MSHLNRLLNAVHLGSMGTPCTTAVTCNCTQHKPYPLLILKYVHMNIRFFMELKEEVRNNYNFLYPSRDGTYRFQGAEVFFIQSESHPDFILNFE